MKPKVQIDASRFNAFCREMATMSGKEYAYVLRSEGASCIKIAALQSPIASASEIDRQVEERGHSWDVRRLRLKHIDAALVDTGFEVSINLYKAKNRVWFAEEGWAKPYMVFDAGPSRGHHVPDGVWQEYLLTAGYRDEYLKLRKAELKKRRGIERQSWIQMGDAMGIDLENVAPQGSLRADIARGATVRGKQFSNGTARDIADGANFAIEVENASPVAIKRNGQSRLDGAIARRTKGFETALGKGLYDNLALRAKRHPGIFVTAV